MTKYFNKHFFAAKYNRQVLAVFILSIISYQAIWYLAFSFIFKFQYTIANANTIVIVKLLGELLLYSGFCLHFSYFTKLSSKRAKFILFCLSFLLFVSSLYAIGQYI